MATLVAAFGVPHTPAFPELSAILGPKFEATNLFLKMCEVLRDSGANVIIIFNNDHLNTFFLDRLPAFAIGVTDFIEGPNDETPMPAVRVSGAKALAERLYKFGIEKGFDWLKAQDLRVDHAVTVPLHFMTPDMSIPVIPIFINTLTPPLPTATRCFALGRMVRDAIFEWPGEMRVAVIGTGSFSFEVGGPKMEPGNHLTGIPSPEWAREVQDHIEHRRIDELVAEATAEKFTTAGNVAGELLNWIAMLGCIGAQPPSFMQAQPALGHAFASWDENAL